MTNKVSIVDCPICEDRHPVIPKDRPLLGKKVGVVPCPSLLPKAYGYLVER